VVAEPVAELRLDATHAVRVVAADGGHRAAPVTLADGGWASSVVGDGAGVALLHRLRNRSAVEHGFRLSAESTAAVETPSERAMGVDQTHASWVVGERVVVKWMTQPLTGPHPAVDRLRRLSAAGYPESPDLVGVLEWREPAGGHWVPVVVAQSYLPGTEDGWSWALDEARRALGLRPVESARPSPPEETPRRGRGFGADLGDVVGRMHLALADEPAVLLSAELAREQADEARRTLDVTLRLLEPHDPASYALLAEHRDRIAAVLARLEDAAGTPALPLHGDLHVGQVLRDRAGRYAVVDFDGNPTLPPHLRAAPAPAAGDVATMLVSLENVEHVVRRYAPDLSEHAGLAWTTGEQAAFLAGYRGALGARGDLFDPALVPAYAWEQVCREFLYAIRHDLLEWLYVPAAAVRRRLAPEA
jgi:maltokinase